MTLAIEPALQSNICDRPFRLLQQLLCLLHALLKEILVGRDTHRLLEESAKVKLAQADQIGEIAKNEPEFEHENNGHPLLFAWRLRQLIARREGKDLCEDLQLNTNACHTSR